MKIVCASFQCEANSRAKTHPQKYDFEYFKGDDIFKKLAVKDVFTKAGFEVVPSIYAVALPSATVEKDIYLHYAEQILDTVKKNPDADGVYIFFHGSMEVEEIGSGELLGAALLVVSDDEQNQADESAGDEPQEDLVNPQRAEEVGGEVLAVSGHGNEQSEGDQEVGDAVLLNVALNTLVEVAEVDNVNLLE